MTRLFEVAFDKRGKITIREGIKIKPSLPVEFINKDKIKKGNICNGRVMTVETLQPVANMLYFTGNEDSCSTCDNILVYVPAYFNKTTGQIFAKGQFGIDTFVQMKDGDTLVLDSYGTKEYYFMAMMGTYDIELKRILVVD